MRKVVKDEYGILNSKGEREITLKKVCNIMGIDVPERFRCIENEIHNNLSTSMDDITPGSIYFKMVNVSIPGNLTKWIDSMISKGALVVFVEAEIYYKEEFDKKDYPIIPVEDLIEKCGNVLSYIKDLNDVKTVAVTGTCGKTTTMKFLNCIIPLEYNAYFNKGNLNSYSSVARHIINEVTPDKEMYVQETGASGKLSIRKMAAMLKADAYILLNVFNHHINEYETPNNIFMDKISHDLYLKEDGFGVVNYDDERIANHRFIHRTVSFGINTDKEVDVRGYNVFQNNEYLEMDVLFEGRTVHVKVEILGVQNAYNILAAFTMAKELGISESNIIKGFEAYKSSGIRQNFRKVGDKRLLIDCYNVCEDSLRADLNTLKAINNNGSGKKIAVISGENKLGDEAYEKSFDMGKELDLDDIDYVICVGIQNETPENLNFYAHSRALYEGILSTGYKNVTYVNNTKDFEKKLNEIISPEDILLFKGMYNLNFSPVIDNVFGTAISMNNPYYLKQSSTYKENGFTGRKIKIVRGVDIVETALNDYKNIMIPSSIKGVPVHRIGEGLFKGKFKIKTVDLGNTAINIGRNAFAGCIRLKKINIPSNIKVIEEGAFRLCISLKEVKIEEGTTHIGKNAFYGCIGLKKAYIPESVKYIDETAFDKCKHVEIVRKSSDLQEV